MTYNPQVLVDEHRRPLIVYAKGRIKYHAVAAEDTRITLVELDSLRGLTQALRKGEPYPPRRAASFWLNRDHREITKRAKDVLRSLVSRKQEAA